MASTAAQTGDKLRQVTTGEPAFDKPVERRRCKR
jgi:hypothetical protein